MPFGKLRIKARVRPSRGAYDAETVKEAIIGAWSPLQRELNKEENKANVEQMITHFNDYDEDEDLGDCLFSESADEFKLAIVSFLPEEKMNYFEELFKEEVFDKQSIIDSIDQNVKNAQIAQSTKFE